MLAALFNINIFNTLSICIPIFESEAKLTNLC